MPLEKSQNKMKQCFLIDDDREDHDIFCMALSEVDKDIVCHKTDNAAEAIRIFKNDPLFVPDFIFIDVNMPRVSGINCLKQLRELPHLAHVDVYMYSTVYNAQIAAESAQYGAQFMIKPANLNILIAELRRILIDVARQSETTDDVNGALTETPVESSNTIIL